MTNTSRNTRRNRAVSPVIGVILMVAITVILAAVIGAFVLEIGDQQETAPNTSFESEQRVVFFADAGGTVQTQNLTTVTVSHAGGEVLDNSQIDLSVNGNTSVYDVDQSVASEFNLAVPLPDTGDPGERVTTSSGESWRVVAYGIHQDTIRNTVGFERVNHAPSDPPESWITVQGYSFSCGNCPPLSHLATGDEVRVVWSAESGGKTQTLFEYSVQ